MSRLLVILLLTAQTVLGQSPGYMGRKLLVTGEAAFLNALFNPNYNMNQGLNKFSFNIRSIADLDYVIARNGSVGATFDVFFTGMSYKWVSNQYPDQLIPNISPSYEHARISGYGYGLNYKMFRNPSKGGIAPIGGYAKFGLMLLDVRAKPYDKSNSTTYAFTDRFFTPVVSVTFGQQRILWDFLVLRSGIQVGFVPLGISPYLQGLDRGIERNSQEQDLRANAESRLFSYYLLNVNFGVGFLLPFRKSYRSTN